MLIDDDNKYYGAGVLQVAEDPNYTTINQFRRNGKGSRCAYLVNDNIGLYMKHAGKPRGKAVKEYVFNFSEDNIKELAELKQRRERVFLGLVCVHDRQICCVPYSDFLAMVASRKAAKGASEETYTILASLTAGGRFRVYVNAPGRKGRLLGKPRIIPRNAFPAAIFK